MHPYQYTVSIRLWHPYQDLSRAAKVFRLATTRCWLKGQARATPKGAPLTGVYPNSYWYADLTKKRISSKRQSLEVFLAKAVTRYGRHRTFVRGLARSGGHAEFCVGIFAQKNFGLELPPDLLREAGKAGFMLALDVYP